MRLPTIHNALMTSTSEVVSHVYMHAHSNTGIHSLSRIHSV